MRTGQPASRSSRFASGNGGYSRAAEESQGVSGRRGHRHGHLEYTPIAALIALVLGTLVVAIGKVSETFVIIGNVAGR